MVRGRLVLTIGVLLGIACLTQAALSQTEAVGARQTGAINFESIIIALTNQLFTIVGAVATYIINKRVRDQQLANMLSNSINYALGTVQKQVAAAGRRGDLTITARSPEIAAGVQYVLDNAAEAVKRFEISPERIAQKIEARLGLAEIATNLAATSSPALPAMVNPLEPVPPGRS